MNPYATILDIHSTILHTFEAEKEQLKTMLG